MNTLALVTLAASAKNVWTWILSILVIALAIGISVIVSLQSTKEGGVSSNLASSSDSFFGKSKTMTKDRALSLATLICSIVFVVLVMILVILLNAGK